jgi:hypothetical protein
MAGVEVIGGKNPKSLPAYSFRVAPKERRFSAEKIIASLCKVGGPAGYLLLSPELDVPGSRRGHLSYGRIEEPSGRRWDDGTGLEDVRKKS